ncbi:phosphoadenylyl-sulfate reductase [cf. Phormidesmis sp. LEGE 11477]|uniref:phosphoadenylyl-sulfate reductase n=1 Tax=cf. Phormidesmis sp. LEGE 11477 TaxID=1828680 RepID=UPI001881F78F|nr:phosphoadenylyl-sulfate reductase [cf. Phormidesmis sp. LEGE 11477]MBE9059623.1 phosphoadenylyl-sulfate reductase [cf. Phormidesmis sp. LEGE 11477]
MTSALPRLHRLNEGNSENPPLNDRPQLGPELTPEQLKTLNQKFDQAKATELIEWGAKTFGNRLVMSTSFGIQSAVMLGLVTEVIPDIPVIWVDTGYLPAETYRFAEQLTQRLSLNLKVYQSPLSPARMEALYGRLWEEGTVEAFNQYDAIRKVEPMNRALAELGARAWLTGLRSQQTEHRRTLDRIDEQAGRYKLLPILHWHSKDVYDYLKAHDLPYHPFFEQGYVSVGDWHSSRPLTADDLDARSTRFNGLKQECGIHIPQTPEEAESLNSSSL